MPATAYRFPARCQLELHGRDRATFLHGFCTQDIKRLQPGQGGEAFVTSIKGRVLAHIAVSCHADQLSISAVAGTAERLIPHLDRYVITEQVRFVDRSQELTTWHLWGTAGSLEGAALELGIPALDTPLAALATQPPGSHVATEWNAIPFLLRRHAWYHGPGWELVAPAAAATELEAELARHGQEFLTASAYEFLRIHSGYPTYGRDITDERLAQEVDRTAQAISFHKGCYLGQEPIARIDALGHVNRLLTRLSTPAGYSPATQVPPDGTELWPAEADSETPIGFITSAAADPAGREVAALAYVRTQARSPGALLTARWKTEWDNLSLPLQVATATDSPAP